MKFLIILVLLTSCGKSVEDLIQINTENDPRKTMTTNKVFNDYILEFLDNGSLHLNIELNVSKIPVNFGVSDDNYLGFCYYYGNKKQWREIKINENLWNNLSEGARQALISHELGHCALNRTHDDEYYKGIPTSVMNSYSIGKHFSNYEDNYNEELFTKNKDNLKISIDTLR